MTIKDLCEALSVNTRVTISKEVVASSDSIGGALAKAVSGVTGEPITEVVADFYSNSIGAIDESVAGMEIEKIDIEVAQLAIARLNVFAKGEENHDDSV